MNAILKYTGEKPLQIAVGNFRGSFEPEKESVIEDHNFAIFLLQRDDFQVVEKRTLDELKKLKREVLNDMAREKGVSEPEQMANKDEVAEAILAAEIQYVEQEETENE